MANNYLTYATFESVVDAIDGDYIEDMLSDVATNDAERQAYCEDILIANAESMVNGYVSKQRETPVPSTSQYFGMIKQWVINIAWYELERLGHGDDVRTKLRDAYDDTIDRLRDVARGSFNITDDDGEGPGTAGTSFTLDSDDAYMTVGELGSVF